MGESEEVQQLFDHMFQKGVAPDCETYTSFITMLCQENKYEQALEIFKRSLTQDAKVASSVLNMFILALCKKGINDVLAAAQIVFYISLNNLYDIIFCR